MKIKISLRLYETALSLNNTQDYDVKQGQHSYSKTLIVWGYRP
ncbi:MAG: hypothetical protein WC966_02600 [Bradymonadales bacterium]